MAKRKTAYWLSIALRMHLVLLMQSWSLSAQADSPPDLVAFDKLKKYMIIDKGSISEERVLRLKKDFRQSGIEMDLENYDGSKVTKLENVLNMVKSSKDMNDPVVVVIVSDFVQEERNCATADDKDGCYKSGQGGLKKSLEEVPVKESVIALLFEVCEDGRGEIVVNYSSKNMIKKKFKYGSISNNVGVGVTSLESMYNKYRKDYRKEYGVELDLIKSAVLCRGVICIHLKEDVNVKSVICNGTHVTEGVKLVTDDKEILLVYDKPDNFSGTGVDVRVETEDGVKSESENLNVIENLVDATYLKKPNLSWSVYYESVFLVDVKNDRSRGFAQGVWVDFLVEEKRMYVNTPKFGEPDKVLLCGNRPGVGYYACRFRPSPVLNYAVDFVKISAYVCFILLLAVGWRGFGDGRLAKFKYIRTINGIAVVVMPFGSMIAETVMWWVITVDSPEAVTFRSISISFVVVSMITAFALLFAQKVARKTFESQVMTKDDVIEWSKIVSIRWVLIVGIIAFIVFAVCWWLLIR